VLKPICIGSIGRALDVRLHGPGRAGCRREPSRAASAVSASKPSMQAIPAVAPSAPAHRRAGRAASSCAPRGRCRWRRPPRRRSRRAAARR
jgi:hypothetical protein